MPGISQNADKRVVLGVRSLNGSSVWCFSTPLSLVLHPLSLPFSSLPPALPFFLSFFLPSSLFLLFLPKYPDPKNPQQSSYLLHLRHTNFVRKKISNWCCVSFFVSFLLKILKPALGQQRCCWLLVAGHGTSIYCATGFKSARARAPTWIKPLRSIRLRRINRKSNNSPLVADVDSIMFARAARFWPFTWIYMDLIIVIRCSNRCSAFIYFFYFLPFFMRSLASDRAKWGAGGGGHVLLKESCAYFSLHNSYLYQSLTVKKLNQSFIF